MAKGFWIKTGVGQIFDDVRNFYVKTGISGWAQITDAWVKTGLSTWSKFWEALMAPTNTVELLESYTGTDSATLRLQGKNYKWVPNPQTLKYYFRWIPEGGSTYYIGASGSSGDTTSNPVTSTTLPGTSSYITISPSGSNFELGKINRYYFEVRATGASGSVYSSISQEDVKIVSPKAPTLAFTVLSSTSVSITITSASFDDYYATNRYILYTYDGTAGFVYSGGGRGGFGVSQTTTRTLTGLVSGRNYTVYVLPVTGFSGTTPSNYSGYPGIEAYLSGVTAGTAAATSPTSITAANNGSYTTVSISWSGASNAVYYRVRWVGYQDTSIDPAVYYDKQITAVNSTSGSWNWGPGDPDKDGAVPYSGVAYYYHVSSSADGTTWSPYTVSSTAVGTLAVPAPTIISGYEPVNTNTSGTRNFSVTNGSWNNSPTGYSYQWKAFTYLPYPPYTSTINVGTNSSLYSGISTYDGYSIYCVVTATNAGGDGTATSNSITQVAPGVAPSGGGVTLTPAGTQQAGTTISANVTAMSGTSPITYVTTIRKATGASPTGSGTAVASGSGTGNAVASHTITTGEASGTPDQFKAYTVGSNAYGDFTVGSNTVISTPYVATQYTVTWNANGGTGGTTTTQDAGTAHSAPAATRSGYTLSNWRNPQTGGDPIFVSAGGTYTPTASITFWAQWTAVVVSAPSGGTATSTPSTGTAGTTTYVGSTSGWSGSPTSYTYSWQYFSQSSFSYVEYSSGTNFSPPAGINTTYPNYGWRLSVGATNSGGTTYATTSITVNNPAVVSAPSTPTGVTLSGSGAVSWSAVSGADSYEVQTYTDRTGSPANTTNRLGPYTATGITGTTYQLSSTDNYASPNNYARVQVRARNTGGVSTYSAWVPSSTTYT